MTCSCCSLFMNLLLLLKVCDPINSQKTARVAVMFLLLKICIRKSMHERIAPVTYLSSSLFTNALAGFEMSAQALPLNEGCCVKMACLQPTCPRSLPQIIIVASLARDACHRCIVALHVCGAYSWSTFMMHGCGACLDCK